MSENESEHLDSTTSMVSIIEGGSDEEIQMLLGGRDRIRHAGILRAGKQAPLKSCTPEEKALFLKLEAEGLTYDDINRKMGGQPKSNKSKLTMTNTDHFVIRDCEFKRPSDADYILSHYADSDGLVRKIPVFFTVTDIDRAIPHGFCAFNGSGQIRCKSFYDGNVLKFRYIEKSVAVPKDTDWKILDSDDEDEATKACGWKVTFSGMYRVNVVGLRGIGECIVPNRSYNGMGDAVALLKKIKKRLGRFDGLLNGEPFLELCKVQEYVKHEGKRVRQSIITLELSIDPMEIERYAEPSAVAARASNALRSLTGQRCAPAAVQGPRTLNEVRTAEDLPPLAADPAAPAEESGAEVAHQEPGYDFTVARDALKALIEPHALSLGEMSIYAASQGMGTGLADMTKAEMTTFFKHVRLALHTDAPSFIENVRKIADTDDATEVF